MYIDDNDYPKVPDRRSQPHVRLAINQYLKNGWEIVGRDPLRLQRGRAIKVYKKGILIDERQN